MPNPHLVGPAKTLVIWTQKRILTQSRHWLASANLFWGVLIGLPWLAPILMRAGATGLAKGIYTSYSFLCHQLANRSFFLFGSRLMYSYTHLLSYAADANTYPGLRALVGAPELGYKVAWSDRMVSLYGGIFLGGVLFALLRARLKAPRWGMFLLLLVPIALDGTTHLLGDLRGVGQGFRYDNAWLATITQDTLPARFYVGNALGSFNSWMRLVSGLLAGLGVTRMLYPLLDDAFREVQETLTQRYSRASPDG